MRSFFGEIGWALWSLKIWFLQQFEYVRHLEDEVNRLEDQLEDPSRAFDHFLDISEEHDEDDDDWEDDDEDEDGDHWKDDWESYHDEDGYDDEDGWEDEDEDDWDIIDTELADEDASEYGRHIG